MDIGAIIAISVVGAVLLLVLIGGLVLWLLKPKIPPYAPVFSDPNLTPYNPSWASPTLTFQQAVTQCENDPKCDVFQQITPSQAAWMQKQVPQDCKAPNPPISCAPNVIAYTVLDKSKAVSVGNYGYPSFGPSLYAKHGVTIKTVSPPPYADIEDQGNVNKYSPAWASPTLTYEQAVTLCQNDKNCDALMYVSPEQQAVRNGQDPTTCNATPTPSYCVSSVYPATIPDKKIPIIVQPREYTKGPNLFLKPDVGYGTPFL